MGNKHFIVRFTSFEIRKIWVESPAVTHWLFDFWSQHIFYSFNFQNNWKEMCYYFHLKIRKMSLKEVVCKNYMAQCTSH